MKNKKYKLHIELNKILKNEKYKLHIDLNKKKTSIDSF